MGNDMNRNPPRLDLDRARAALARTREEGAMAVRAPRPADLSRLREEADRRHRIETRAGAFRMELRTQLGLADTQGPYSALPLNMSGVIGHALCDADICSPEPPMAAPAERTKADPAPAIAPAAPATAHAATDNDTGEAVINDAVENEPVAAPGLEAGPAPQSEAPRKRKKFLGLF